MTEAEFKEECLQRFQDGGPNAAHYALAAAMMGLADVIEAGLGTSDPSKRNALEDIAVKLKAAVDALAEAVERLGDAHF